MNDWKETVKMYWLSILDLDNELVTIGSKTPLLISNNILAETHQVTAEGKTVTFHQQHFHLTSYGTFREHQQRIIEAQGDSATVWLKMKGLDPFEGGDEEEEV